MLMGDLSTPYSAFVREERHLAAILFHLLCDPKNCRSLLKEFAPEWDIDTARGDWAVYFEYAYLRDYWHQLGRKRDEKGHSAANQRKYDYLSSMFALFSGANASEFFYDISNFAKFNRSVSTRHSDYALMSPARWQVKKIRERSDIDEVTQKAAITIAWMFRIKPDLVIQPSPSKALCLELKIESRLANYSSAPSDKSTAVESGQMALQRTMMRKLFGNQNVSFGLITSDPSLSLDGEYATRTWAQIFSALGPQQNQPGFVMAAIKRHDPGVKGSSSN